MSYGQAHDLFGFRLYKHVHSLFAFGSGAHIYDLLMEICFLNIHGALIWQID